MGGGREAEAAASEATGLESAKKAAVARKDYKVQSMEMCGHFCGESCFAVWDDDSGVKCVWGDSNCKTSDALRRQPS